MSRVIITWGVLALTLLQPWGCAMEPEPLRPPVRVVMQEGDRERDWALVYFQSWRQSKEGTYLELSRQHLVESINTYFILQLRIGHSYPDFYVLDQRRTNGCRFLNEIERLAARFRVTLGASGANGCQGLRALNRQAG